MGQTDEDTIRHDLLETKFHREERIAVCFAFVITEIF
jgi:hypothetical protein